MKKVLKYSFCFFKGRAKGTTFMLVILAVSYFAHIVISLSYFFQNTNVWIIVVFIHEKTEAPTQNIPSTFQSLKDTKTLLGLLHTLKCLVFYVLCHSGLFFAGKVRSKTKS